MAKKTRASTGVAMRITRMDRVKFNQAVNDGFYTCAPDAIPGVRRVFDLNDLVGLYFFAEMIRDDEPTRKAGQLACRIVEQLRRDPEATHVYVGRNIIGASFASTDVNVHAAQLDGLPVHSIRIFHVGNAREFILLRLEEEDSIVGED